MSRFPYFDPAYLEISLEVRSALKDAHRILIQAELGCGEMLREISPLATGITFGYEHLTPEDIETVAMLTDL